MQDENIQTQQTEQKVQQIPAKDILKDLAAQFPKCFILDGEGKPLKIGIFQELATLMQNKYTRTELRGALRLYTNNWRYLHGCKEGSQRIDLYGNVCGPLEDEHIQYAKNKLAASKSAYQKTLRQKQKAVKEQNLLNKRNEFLQSLQINSEVRFHFNNKVTKGIVVNLQKETAAVELPNKLIINIKIKQLF